MRLEQKIAAIAIPSVLLVGGVAFVAGSGGGSDGAPVSSVEKGGTANAAMGEVEVFWETASPATCHVTVFADSKSWSHDVTVDESETVLTSDAFNIGAAAAGYTGYEVSCHE